MPNVRGHDAGRKAICDPEEAAVPVLPSAPRHAAPQDVAQGSVARGGQACCGGVAQGTGGHNPEESLLTSDSEDSALVTSDEEEGGEPEKSRLCMQMVPVEANNIVQGLHTLYDWGSTVSLVGRESMKRLGFRPAQVAQRIVNGLGGAAVVTTGCHFFPLIDVKGNHQGSAPTRWKRLPQWLRRGYPPGPRRCSHPSERTCRGWIHRQVRSSCS
jgi:hypothetical protein